LDKFKKSWGSDNSSGDPIAFRGIPKFGERDLVTLELLGKGAFSDVFKAFNKKNTDKMLAIKRLQPHVQNDAKLLPPCVADQALETAILANLNHENIISLRGIKKGTLLDLLRTGTFFFALDPLGGTLEGRLEEWREERAKQRLRRAFEPSHVVKMRLQSVALGVAKGMEYMHSKRVLYRDMKPANIGFDEETDQVKIFDFGLSRVMGQQEISSPRNMTMRVGTPRYMAPEIARDSDRYCFPVDVYSFSLILWQMVSNQIPFEEIKSLEELKERVANDNLRPPLKFVKSDALKSLLEAAWANDPNNRPCFFQIIARLESIIGGDNSTSGKKPRRNSLGYFSKNGSSQSTASSNASVDEPKLTRHVSAPDIDPPKEVHVENTTPEAPRRRRTGRRQSDPLIINGLKELDLHAEKKERKSFRLFRKRGNSISDASHTTGSPSINDSNTSFVSPPQTSIVRRSSAPLNPIMTSVRRLDSTPLTPTNTSMRRQGSVPMSATNMNMGRQISMPLESSRYQKAAQPSSSQMKSRRRRSLIDDEDTEDEETFPKKTTQRRAAYPSSQPTRTGRQQKLPHSKVEMKNQRPSNTGTSTRRTGRRQSAPHAKMIDDEKVPAPPKLIHRSSAPMSNINPINTDEMSV